METSERPAQATLEKAIQQVEERLAGQVPPHVLSGALDQSLRAFQDARIAGYLPVLIEKFVRDHLRPEG